MNVEQYLTDLAKLDLEVFLYCDTLYHTSETSSLMLTIETDDGIIGWGETITKACEEHERQREKV